MNSLSDSIHAEARPVNVIAKFGGRGVQLETIDSEDPSARWFTLLRHQAVFTLEIKRVPLRQSVAQRQRRVLHPNVFRQLRNSVFVAHSVHNSELLFALSSRVRALYCALHGVPTANRVALAARSRLSVCNLAEFAQMAALAGIACPSVEDTANLEAVAVALRAYLARVPAGDLVVTLGVRGVIAAKSHGRAVAHISMRLTWTQRERLAVLKTEPKRLQRVGARFFAALVSAYAEAEELFGAARQAVASVVNTLAAGLQVGAAQAELRLFAL